MRRWRQGNNSVKLSEVDLPVKGGKKESNGNNNKNQPSSTANRKTQHFPEALISGRAVPRGGGRFVVKSIVVKENSKEEEEKKLSGRGNDDARVSFG